MSDARRRLFTPGFAALLLIVVLGAALRAFHLTRESVWMEEAWSLDLARGSLSYMIERTASDAHPPLYYAALHYWRMPFGDSEAALRSLSVLFSVLTIPALYRLAARLYDRATGLAAALLLALSVPNILLSQEARMQPLLLLLTVLSMDYFHRLTTGARGRVFWLYVLSSALMLYTQYYGFFTLAAQMAYLGVLFVLARDAARQVWTRCVLGQALAGLLFVPWLPVFARQFSGVQQSFWILQVKLRGFIYGLSEYAGAGALGRVVRPIALGAALVGVFRPVRPDEPSARLSTWYLLIWIAAVAGIPWAISQFSSPIFLPRYAMSASLALLVLAARGLTWLPGRSTQVVATGLVVVFSVAALPAYFGSIRKDQWRPAVARLEAAAQPGDLVLFNWGAGKLPFDYYAKRKDLIEVPMTDQLSAQPKEEVVAAIASAVDGRGRVWLMLSHANPGSAIAMEYLKAHYDLRSEDNVPGVVTYLFVH